MSLRVGARTSWTSARAHWGLFVAALLPRLLFWFEWRRAGLLNLPVVDGATFDAEARGLLAGTWPGPNPFWQAPLYSYFLAGLYRLFGWNWDVARLSNALLGAISCVLVFRLAHSILPRRWAFVAFAFTALSGPLLYFEGQLLRETLGTCLLLAFTVQFARSLPLRGSRDRPTNMPRAHPVQLTFAGVLLSLTALCRENALVLAPLAVGAIVLRSPRRLRDGAAFVLGLFAALAPVTAHNLRHAHAPVPISTSGGINFFLGNNARSEATMNIRPGRDWKALTARPWREARVIEPAAQSRWFFDQAWDWIHTHPGDFVSNLTRKTSRFVSTLEWKRNQDPYEARHGSKLLSLLFWRIGGIGFPFVLLGPLGLAGAMLAISRRRSDLEVWLGLTVLCFAAGVILFFPSARHRAPILPLLAIFMAGSCRTLWDARGFLATSGVFRRAASPSVAFARWNLALVPVFVALGLGAGSSIEGDPAEQSFLRGTALASLGRDVEAARELERAVAVAPGHAEAWSDLAVLRGRAGDLEGALIAARSALRADSTFAEAWADLASVHAARGDSASARVLYQRALTLEPDLGGAAAGLARVHADAGKLEAAARVLQAGVEQTPRDADLWIRLAGLQSRLGQPIAAEGSLGRALEQRPRDADAWNNLGIAIAQQGRNDEASQAFAKALELDPTHESALKNLQRARSKRGS